MPLIDCVFDRWSPQIGDPTVMGWVTVIAYGIASAFCFLSVKQSPGRSERSFWLCLGLALAFLMVNKQLDLQSSLTALGRCVSQIQGWYEDRKPVQIAFIAGLLAATSVCAVAMFRAMKPQLRFVWLALLGSVCLLAFVAVRAVGFHHFDAVINFRVQSVRMNWVLELGGITMIALNAIWTSLFRPRLDVRPPNSSKRENKN